MTNHIYCCVSSIHYCPIIALKKDISDADEGGDSEWPCKLEAVLKMRAVEHVKPANKKLRVTTMIFNPEYEDFIEHFLPAVVGKRKWESEKAHDLLSDIVTPSAEAFAFLLYENNFLKWQDLATKLLTDPKATTSVRPLYTNSGMIEKNGRNKKLNGWSKPGVVRWNELCKLVKENRALPNVALGFEKSLLEKYQREAADEAAQKPTKKPASRPEGEEYNGVVAMHDLWDDDHEEAIVEHASGATSE